MALTYTPASPDFGTPAANFTLPGVDGRSHSLTEYQNGHALLIMFICNHCPYVQAIEDRLIQLALDAKKINCNVIAISANDPNDYPEDSFAKMQERANAKKYPFPYLQDLSQEVAKSYGAVCTPDFFLYDGQGRLAYRGRLDDSWKNPENVTKRELWEAMQLIEQKQPLSSPQTPSMGCSIKWSKK